MYNTYSFLKKCPTVCFSASAELQRQKALALARLNARRKLTQQKPEPVELEEEEKHRLTEQANLVSALDAEGVYLCLLS